MSETLYKRLVGALVLIGLGILLPFVLIQWLEGPASGRDDHVRVYELTPEGEARPVSGPSSEPAPEADTRPETSEVSTAEAPPKTEASPAGTPGNGPEPGSAVRRSDRDPQARPESTAETGSQEPSWSVQVGSFQSEDNARNLKRELTADFPAFYREGEVDGVVYYRVRLGPYADEAEAEQAASAATARGLRAQVRREP